MNAGSPSPEPTTATVTHVKSGWVTRVYGSDTLLLSETPLRWDGVGFYSEGLNAVARSGAIPNGFAYEGAQAWDHNSDGSYSVVLYRLDPRFA